MEGSKRIKKGPFDEAIDALSKPSPPYQPWTPEELEDFVKTLAGLKPSTRVTEDGDAGVLETGSGDLDRDQSDGKTDSGGENDEDPDAKDEEPIEDTDEDHDAKDEESIEDTDDETDGEDEEGGAHGRDFVPLQGGRVMPVSQYFGHEWEQLIIDLHSVQPLPMNPHMPTKPHDYQLKGAAQIDYMCKSPFRGCLVGDPMGLGKTLQAILSMKVIADEPGIIAVFCPANLCIQWVKAIEEAFDQGDQMSALHLNDPSVSAHSILAGGYDVVVCSFEFAEANVSRKQKFKAQYQKAKNDPNAAPIKRPTIALATDFWKIIGLPIKRGYIDEAQMVNKRDGKKHAALMALPVSSWCIMSGTLAHNRWYDVSGYFDFIKGHPYKDDSKFMLQFSNPSYNGKATREISGPQLYLLQRFLQAFLIMRPQEVLNLPPCRRLLFKIKATDAQQHVMEEWAGIYQKICNMKKKPVTTEQEQDATEQEQDVTEQEQDDQVNPLWFAIRAQLHGLHPRLAPYKKEAKIYELGEEDLENVTAAELNRSYQVHQHNRRAKRLKWLEELEEWTPEMWSESPHLRTVIEFLDYMVKTHPDQKIVVISQYLRYLDIIALAMRKEFDIKCLRYDGTVSQVERIEVQDQFAATQSARPLLMTVGAGSVGLNLTSGKVMVILEEWWNISVENQAISRCHRQGAKGKVIVVKFHIENSLMEGEIARVRSLKEEVNKMLMKPLVHRHDEIPKVRKLLY